MQLKGHSDERCPADELERTTPPPLAEVRKPEFILAPMACDAHCHVFGPHNVFPYAPDRPFTPHDVPKEMLRARHDRLGFSRVVVVQSSCHGTDHAAAADVIAQDPRSYRGVALLAPGTSQADVRKLDSQGFCGVRFNFMTHLGADPDPKTMRRLIGLVEPFGWHVAIHVTGDGILRQAAFIRSIPVPVVIDHIARLPVKRGHYGEGFGELCRVLDTGNVYLKLSGADRVSCTGAPYEDAAGLARDLALRYPERVLWGTDFPHPNISGDMPDDADLVDLIPSIAPDARTQHLMLVENPARLFRFRDPDIT